MAAVVKYCDEYLWTYVCVCPSVHGDISESHVQSLQNLVHVAYGHGSVILRRCCDMLCTFGIVDDIMCHFYNGPYSSMNFAMNRFRLNLLIYYEIRQNSISYY